MYRRPTVFISCPIYSISGYGEKSREFVRALTAIEDRVAIYVYPTRWGNSPNYMFYEFQRFEVHDLSLPADVRIHIGLPDEVSPNTDILVTSLNETTALPQHWIPYLSIPKFIIVPSHFNKNVLRIYQPQLNIPLENIIVLPEALHPCYFSDSPVEETIDSIKVPENTFLCIGQFTQFDRKGILDVLRVFSELPYSLFILPGVYSSLQLANFLDFTRPHKNFFVLKGFLPHDAMKLLYNHPNICGFITLTKGESFGRPIFEALSQGLPVIAPVFSGYVEYLPSYEHFIGCDLVPVPRIAVESGLFSEKSLWAKPHLPEAVKKVEEIVTNNTTVRQSVKYLQPHLKTLNETAKSELVDFITKVLELKTR